MRTHVQRFHKKYFEFSFKTFLFGGIVGILACICALLHVHINPKHIYFIIAALGVFVISLSVVQVLKEPAHKRVKYAFWLSVCAGLSTSLGSLISQYHIIAAIIIALFMFCLGLSILISAEFFNVVLLISDMLIIGTGLPAKSFNIAIEQGLSFFIGGIFVTIFIAIFALVCNRNLKLSKFFTLVKPCKITSISVRFGTQLAIAVVSAYGIATYLNLPDSYWLPMTALLLLRHEQNVSFKRIKHRFWGTILGSFIAIPISFIPDKTILAFLMLPLMFLIVISAAKHYGSYVFFLTIMITVLLSFISDLGGIKLAGYRNLDTCLGILCVAVVIFVFTFLQKRFLFKNKIK